MKNRSTPFSPLRHWPLLLIVLLSIGVLFPVGLHAGWKAPTPLSSDVAQESAPPREGEQVPEGLTGEEWRSIQEQIRAAEYQATWHSPRRTHPAPSPPLPGQMTRQKPPPLARLNSPHLADAPPHLLRYAATK